MPDHHTVLSEILKHVPHARFKGADPEFMECGRRHAPSGQP